MTSKEKRLLLFEIGIVLFLAIALLIIGIMQ
ncbi:MAG: hypothetical protein RL220_2001 [Bacteroidota bacterium]